MPSRPSWPNCLASSRTGRSPISNHSATYGVTCSAQNCLTVSRTASSSSDREASSPRGSYRSKAGGLLVLMGVSLPLTSHREAAADADHLSGNERRGIGCEEQHRCGDFLRPGQAAKRDRSDQSLFQLLGLCV